MMEHGTVTNVEYKKGVPVCSVRLQKRVDTEDKTVPVMRQHHGMFMVPEEGQKVQMLKLDEQRFIIGILNNGNGYDNPDLSEGELAFKLDSDTKLTFTENSNGDIDVNVKASGKVYIEGTAFSDHTHDYDDSTIEDTGDGSGTESTTTKTTDPPS